jgi:3',5'-nucleoside bisphosphate phosphatase
MAPLPRFDLQSHSRHSDGALTPAEVVRAAAAAGVELLALSDHDTVAGVSEAVSAGEELSVRVVPAAEISALQDDHQDLHILGYGLDPDDTALLQALARYRADREARGDRMAAALREVGFAVAEEVLEAQTAQGHSLGRPHLARAVFEHPDNRARLEGEGLSTPETVLQAYLLPGRPGYRGRTIPTVGEAIEVIHAAGGVAVWAHPFWDIDDPRQTLATLRGFAAQGLDGVEAFYVTHDERQTRLLHEAAAELELLTTGSSDFHGPEHRIFSRFLVHELYGLEPRLGPLLTG